MSEKIIIATYVIAISWVVAQATEYAKKLRKKSIIKNGLITELYDIQDQLQRVVLSHTRQLQLVALNGMEPSSVLPVPNMFYQQYFKEAFEHLNREQRISYQLIHSSLESLNSQNNSLVQFFEESYKDLQVSPNDEKKDAIIHVWGEHVIALYKNAMTIRWHIDYHLNNKESPDFDIMGSMHEKYVQFQKDLDDNVKEIIINAKETLNIKDFGVIYDEKIFEHYRKKV